MSQVLFQYCLLSLFLYLNCSAQFVKLFFNLSLKFILLDFEFFWHLLNLTLVNSIATQILHDLVHRYEQFSTGSYLPYNFLFHTNVVIFVRAKKSAVCTNPHSVLQTNYFKLPFMLRAQILLLRIHNWFQSKTNFTILD